MTMRKLVSLTIVMLALTTFGFAQGASTGDLRVTVKDAKGSLVTNATVTARDPAKGLERTGTGGSPGEYVMVLLPPGPYTVTVEAPGFAKSNRLLTANKSCIKTTCRRNVVRPFNDRSSVPKYRHLVFTSREPYQIVVLFYFN